MEEKLGKGIEYNPFKKEDKYYFGGYFNLAENNINDVFTEVKKRLGETSSSSNIELLNNVFRKEMSLVDYEKWVNAFADYFPIVNYLDRETIKKGEKVVEVPREKRIEYFRDMFKGLINTISQLRHYYTHYHHEPIEIDDKILSFLDEVLFNTIITTKNKYLKTDKTKELIKDSLQEELDILCKLKVKYLEDNRKRYDRKDKGAIENAVYNDVFRRFIYKDQKGNESLKDVIQTKQIKVPQNSSYLELPISSSGIIFLLSLFLNKKEVESLKSNIRGYKGKSKSEETTPEKNGLLFMTTHRIYSVLAYKGLKKRIKTSVKGDKETLLMQMIDEVSKVPHCIYQNLDQTLQATFIEDWNEYFKDNEENEENLENSRVLHPVIRKRYEDKFNYFAIRFLDEYAEFPSLRFQVNLGNYVHHKATKKFGNSEVITERVIKDKVTVFGRLSEVNKAKADFFKNETELDPAWELFPNPSYEFPKEKGNNDKDAGKIGIQVKLLNKDIEALLNESKNTLNNKTRKSDKISKKEIINKIVQINDDTKDNNKNIIYQGNAIAYLSLNEIHSLLYELLVIGTKGEKLERKIVEKIQQQVSEIRNKDTSAKILSKYKNSEESNTIDKKKLVTDLKHEYDELQDLLKEHKNREEDFIQTKKKKKDSPKRKYILYHNEKGQVAVWLSNDIKRFMPQNFKEKWKGYQHSEFQKSLAYYETNKEMLKIILQDLDLEQFPFDIKSCFYKNTLEDFYSRYLSLRISYLENVLDRVKCFSNELKAFKSVLKECFVFLKKQNYTNHSLDEQVKKILANPIFIERGFLDTKPTMIQGVKFSENKGRFADWFVHYKEYEHYQKFYDTNLYPVESIEDKERQKLEATIKKQQKNDVFTLLMIKKIFNDLFNQDFEANLYEMYQSKEERENNQLIAKETQNRNLNFIWNKPIAIDLFDGKVKIDEVKLKDVGSFRKYENDKRVETFIKYHPEIQWIPYLPNTWEGINIPVNVIERQIDRYEKVRSEELLKEVQAIEKYIYEQVNDKTELLQNGNQNFKNYLVNGLLKQIQGIDVSNFKFINQQKFETINVKDLDKEASVLEQKVYVLINIRNQFSHNQFPKSTFYQFCQKILLIEEDELFADYYLRLFKLLRNELLD